MPPVKAGTAYVTVEPDLSRFRGRLAREMGPLARQFSRDFSKAAGATDGTAGATTRLGRAAGRSGRQLAQLDRATGNANRGMRAVGRGAAYALGGAGVGGGLHALADVTKRAVGEFRESQRVGRQTAAVLRSTGGAAGVSARHVGDLATAISRKTGIDDEAVQSSANLLLTFTKVRNEAGRGNQVFDEATKAVTDMSVALGQDGKSSAIQLGKALNDPVRGVTALSRVGVAFTAQQKAQIKALVESGRTLDAQKVILRELGAEFGGSAAAQNTAGRQLSVTLGNLGETVGGVVAPALDRAAADANRFVGQMLAGRGQGGRFVEVLRGMSDELGPVAVGVAKAAVGVGRFAGAHPQLTKLAAAAAATGVAVNAIRTSRAVAGVSALAGALRGLARTRAGEAAANSITSALGGVPGRSERALGRTRSVFARALGGAGRAGGAAAAEGVAAVAGDRVVASAGRGGSLGRSFARAGRVAGRAFGAAGAAYAVVEITRAVDRELSGKSWRRAFGGDDPRTVTREDPLGIGGLLGIGRRGGGLVFGGGGLVPAMLSSGELAVEPSGRAWTVPGRRRAADDVAAMVPGGTAILTDSGRRMLSGGASLSQALARQGPHFRAGGTVRAGTYSSTSYGPPWGGIQGTGVTRTGVDLRGAPRVYGVATDPAVIPLGASLRIRPNPFGTRKPFRAFDTGGAVRGRRVDFYDWRGRRRQRAWGRRPVQVARAGTGRGGAGPPTSATVTTPAGTTRPLLGSLLSPLVDDALLGGIEAGRAGTGRLGLLTRVLEGIAPEPGDRATRRRVPLAAPTTRGKAKAKGKGGAGGGRPPGGLVPQVARALAFARGRGWRGTVTSGLRSRAEQARLYARHLAGGPVAAPPGRSNHERGRAVDVTDVPGFARAMRGAPANARLLSLVPGDPVHFSVDGHRRGGVVGYAKGGRVPRRRPRRIRRPPTLGALTRGLAGSPGEEGADRLARALSGRVAGRSLGALLRARKDVLARVRALARDGLTGPERIQARRLRGALALVEDELGRPVGRALGGSGEARDAVTRSLGRLDDELTVAGTDPDSEAGRQAKAARTRSAIGSLVARRADLGGALARARATGSRAAVAQVQGEIDQVDDQVLGLRAALVSLTEATEEQTAQAEAEFQRERAGRATDLLRQANLRTAASEAAFAAFRGFDREFGRPGRLPPPYVGSFGAGGTVPGPAGAPRVVVAHGGETIVPAGREAAGQVVVRVTVLDGAVDPSRIQAVVEGVNRAQARAGGRALPGRGGGGLVG